jgi:beta-glucanase (GH16 family)
MGSLLNPRSAKRCAISLALGCLTWSAPAATGWQLVWSDEFNGPNGSAPDATKWGYDLGNGINGWGNGELQCYTSHRTNSWIEDGNLLIAARRMAAYCNGVTRDYASARLKTESSLNQTYGRFEARIQAAPGQGLWSAFWLLGSNYPTVPWPGCGELDVLENIGSEPQRLFVSAHGPGFSGASSLSTSVRIFTPPTFHAGYYLYAIEWDTIGVRWYVNNVLVQMITRDSLPPGSTWPFDHSFFMILNLAVGGSVPGPPSPTTVFPAYMKVDYVRVYRRISAPSPTLAPTQVSPGQVQLRWPGLYPNARLQRIAYVGAGWVNYTAYAPLIDGQFTATVEPGYYRLVLPGD